MSLARPIVATMVDNMRPTSHDVIIEAVDVVKTYDTGRVQVQALRGVNLTINRGEMVAIMGPSGCGKTTLLNCLSGLDEYDAGDVRISGTSLRDMTDNEKTEYRAKKMGFVFQVYNLLPVLNAAENVELPLLVSGVRPGKEIGRWRHSLASRWTPSCTSCWRRSWPSPRWWRSLPGTTACFSSSACETFPAGARNRS